MPMIAQWSIPSGKLLTVSQRGPHRGRQHLRPMRHLVLAGNAQPYPHYRRSCLLQDAASSRSRNPWWLLVPFASVLAQMAA